MSLPPQNSNHLSNLNVDELIDLYGGIVDKQFATAATMREFVNMKPVRGTDTLTVRNMGVSTVNAITPGVRPAAGVTPFSRAQVTVDTTVYARNNTFILEDIQSDVNIPKEVGMQHGKDLGKLFDQSVFIQGIKATGLPPVAALNGAIGGGTRQTLATAGDELDPNRLYAEIEGIVVALQEREIPTDEMSIFVRPLQYSVLLNHDKLVDRDFSGTNGSFAKGKFATIYGLPVISTPRLPTGQITDHVLSKSSNNNAYDTTAEEGRVCALIMHPDALLAGESITMTHNIHYNDTEFMTFIDSYMAYGLAPRRGDLAAAVLTAAP